MNIISKYIISLVVFFFFGLCTQAQIKVDLGIDVGKTIYNNLKYKSSGFVLEPIVIFQPSQNNFKFKSSFGYASINQDDVYKNSNISVDGFYLKGALGYSDKKHFIPYLNLFLSNYNITNHFYIKGDYFGDYEGAFNQNNLIAFGIEPNLDFNIQLVNKISLLLSLRINVLLVNTSSEDLPSYYIPGAGIINNRYLTGGFSVYFMFNGNY